MTTQPPATAKILAQAVSFLKEMTSGNRYAMAPAELESRLDAIADELERTGTYTHTAAELEFGVQWAWRASNRCIGRHMWRSLKVQDCRDVHDHEGVVSALDHHLDMAWQDGAIQSKQTKSFLSRKSTLV